MFWFNDFDILSHQTPGDNNPGISNGYTVKATIIGTVITAYVNGAVVNSWDTSSDSAPVSGAGPARYTSGQPGIGHFLQGGSVSNCADYGFSSITIREL